MSVSSADVIGLITLVVGLGTIGLGLAAVLRVRASDKKDIADALNAQQETIIALTKAQTDNLTEIRQLRATMSSQEKRHADQLTSVETHLSERMQRSEQRTYRVLRNLAMTAARFGAIATGQGVLVKLEGLFVLVVDDSEGLA